MKRRLPLIVVVLVLSLACPAPVRAHFIWLLPSEPGAKTPAVRMIFSEDLQPDKPELLKKIGQTGLFIRGGNGKTKAAKAELDKDALKAEMPEAGFQEVAGVCTYGVVQRGKAEPFLLRYYAKTFMGLNFGRLPEQITQSWDTMELEIMPEKGGPRVRVLWLGKPLAGVEAVLIVPGTDEKVETKADKDGVISLPAPKKGGPYGIRVLHKEAREGEFSGKKYKEVRHYATLTLQIPARVAKPEEKPAADAAATKLLTDARAARALYHNFPGFTADIEVSINGQVTCGTVEVSDKGKVAPKLDNAGAEKWAKNKVLPIVAEVVDVPELLYTLRNKLAELGFAGAGQVHLAFRIVPVIHTVDFEGPQVRVRPAHSCGRYGRGPWTHHRVTPARAWPDVVGTSHRLPRRSDGSGQNGAGRETTG